MCINPPENNLYLIHSAPETAIGREILALGRSRQRGYDPDKQYIIIKNLRSRAAEDNGANFWLRTQMAFIHVLTFLKDKKENKVGLGEKENKNYS